MLRRSAYRPARPATATQDTVQEEAAVRRWRRAPQAFGIDSAAREVASVLFPTSWSGCRSAVGRIDVFAYRSESWSAALPCGPSTSIVMSLASNASARLAPNAGGVRLGGDHERDRDADTAADRDLDDAVQRR